MPADGTLSKADQAIKALEHHASYLADLMALTNTTCQSAAFAVAV